MVFDPVWQPVWHRSGDGKSWDVWPPHHPQVLFQFGRGYRTDLRNAPPHLDDGRICFYCNPVERSEEHTSELQSLMRTSYAVCCLKKKKIKTQRHNTRDSHI